MTIPGVSHYSALVSYAEFGDVDRFDRAKEFVQYVGLEPVVRESGDSRIEGGISKNGPGKVRWLLVQAVHSSVHTVEDPYLSRFYDPLAQRKNSQKAAVATARKLLVSIFHMLDPGEVYDPPGVSACLHIKTAKRSVGGSWSDSFTVNTFRPGKRESNRSAPVLAIVFG